MAEGPATRAVEVRENIWITMRDGRRLAARLWLPADIATTPAPAIIEYMPYRKRDHSRARDEPIHSWFAARGYAALRVDMHGSGDSDGILRQEFQLQEQLDAIDMIAWVAAQPWCSGAVAMFGKSWGAFAALQAAQHRPPALKAIVAVCGGQDRYDESLHYTGGAPLIEQLWWQDTMVLFNMRPPDPEIVGESWREMWHARLAANEPWLHEWLLHQRRDAFWRHGSHADAPDRIACAVYAVGGWADYISRAVPRLLASGSSPRWGLVGPWGHHYPQDGIPAPAIGFLEACERFFRATLRGDIDAMAHEPMLRAWMPDGRAPSAHHGVERGRWIAEATWPSPRIVASVLHLGADNTLRDVAGAAAWLAHRSPLGIGRCAPEWLSMGLPGEAPGDQRADDGRSLVFDAAPLDAGVEILGAVELDLELRVDRPVAMLVARLCDVAPDGASTRVALGVLNLNHRNGHDRPEALTPDVPFRVRLSLPETAYAFRAGHRIRLALSTSYWPIVWPSPAPVRLGLHAGNSAMTLPLRPPSVDDSRLRPFAPPSSGAQVPITILEPARLSRTLREDGMTGESEILFEGEGGVLGPARRYRIDPIGTVMGHRIRKRFTIRDEDPLSARAELEQEMEIERGDWRIALATSTRFWSTGDEFRAEVEASARDGGTVVYHRRWTIAVPRDFA